MILPGGSLKFGAGDTTQKTPPNPRNLRREGDKSTNPGKAPAPATQKYPSHHHSRRRQKATATRGQNPPQRNGPHQKASTSPPGKVAPGPVRETLTSIASKLTEGLSTPLHS